MPTLYWKNVSTDSSWSANTAGVPINWFTNAAATTPAASVPWTQDDIYKTYDLALATGETAGVNFDSTIDGSFTITGTCSIPSISINGAIAAGTFSGSDFTNNANISGGSFSGANFINSGYIYGGTFSGTGLTNNAGAYIYSGTFSGANLHNNGGISGGYFSGSGMVNGTGSGYIYSGFYTGSDFANQGGIYGGFFTGSGFIANDGTIYGWSNNASGVFFLTKGNLVIEDGSTIRCHWTLASGTITDDPTNGIFICSLSSDILGAGLA